MDLWQRHMRLLGIDIEIHIVYLVLGGLVVLIAFHIPPPAIHPGRGLVKP